MTQVSPILLRNVPLFAGLENEEIDKLAAVATVRTFAKHAVVIREGEHADSIYLINSGKVKVLIGDSEGHEVILSILGPGDYFGEMSLIDSQPRSATVVSMEPVHFAVITKSDFDRCLAHNPRIVTHIMVELAKRLRSANSKIEGLALMDVHGRVARTLIQLAELHNGEMVVDQSLSQQDIANMVGASREMVSRTLRDLSANGFIHVEGKKIVVSHRTFSSKLD
ncbi:MAG: Crp/Fnr family transcriptional regulator [Sulfuricella sp.]|nr:Crp/Fnr family transcriptional regulator [Sulfuricella sp.]